MSSVRYSEALARGDARLADASLHEGPHRDPGLAGVVIVGDVANGMRILENAAGEFSNRWSVTPWWLDPRRPFALAFGALPRMWPIISYPDAMQTLDGAAHRAVRHVVDASLAETQKLSSDAQAAQLQRELQRLDAWRARGTAEPHDLKPAIARVRGAALQAELGLPPTLVDRLERNADEQIRFLWGYPAPARRTHRGLARTVRQTWDATRRLFDDHAAGRIGSEAPNCTRALVEATRRGEISYKVGVATLFGLVNAGAGTASETVTNIAYDLLIPDERGHTRWAELAASPASLRTTVAGLLPGRSAVRAWLKNTVVPVELTSRRGPKLSLRAGERILVVLDAMQRDPRELPPAERRVLDQIAFSAGHHECPGKSATYRLLSGWSSCFIPAAPDLIAHEPGRTMIQTSLTFAGHPRLLVRRRS